MLAVSCRGENELITVFVSVIYVLYFSKWNVFWYPWKQIHFNYLYHFVQTTKLANTLRYCVQTDNSTAKRVWDGVDMLLQMQYWGWQMIFRGLKMQRHCRDVNTPLKRDFTTLKTHHGSNNFLFHLNGCDPKSRWGDKS